MSLEWEECESGAIYAELPDFKRLWIHEDSKLHTLILSAYDCAGERDKTIGVFTSDVEAKEVAERVADE